MRNLGIKNTRLLLSLMAFSVLALTGCSDSKSNSADDTYNDPIECEQQIIPVGIVGNTACPYLGEIAADGSLQPYTLHASVGIGFLIEFGWEYEDECPQDGQLAVFENGYFSYCTGVNPAFARTDFGSTSRANNLGECAGEQYNPHLTGCSADLRPSLPQYSW